MEQTMKEIRTKNPLGYQPIGRLLMKFAIPSVISMLVNAVYNIVDQIFIGQGVGYLGNAATTVAFPIVTIILAVGTMLGAGGSAYAAIKLGEKKEEEAENTLGNVFILLVGIGIVLTVIGLVFLVSDSDNFSVQRRRIWGMRRIMRASYCLVRFFNLLGIGLSNMARCDGSPNVAMYSMVAGALLNCVLDPIYIFVFHWGVQGAAIATITSQIIATIILLYYFTRKGNMRLRLTHTRLNPTICKMAFSLGISSCITQLSSTILQIAMNNSLVYYGNQTSVTGDVALSAMGIVMKISMIIVSICIGIGIGAQPILGFNRGANQPKRIKRCYRLASNIATAVTTVGWAMFMLIPHIILMLFGSADANFTEFAIKAMRIFDLGVFCAGFQVTSTSYFQATGQPMKASILSSLRQLVLLIPLILLLPLHFGLDGILYAGPIADITSAVIIFFFIHHEMKKLDVQIVQESGEELGVYSEPIA